jgi:hypothetical protein
MLRSFRVANHKSIRDETELLLMPAYDKSRPVVPVAAIFGANASGKSNLLDGLRWLREAVLNSFAAWHPGSGVPRTPFRLDPQSVAHPTGYCVEILLGSTRYTYGVEVDDEKVREEWLYTYPHGRRRVIFERDEGGIRVGSTVPDHRVRSDQLGRQTRANALFLTVAALNDLAEVQPVYQWFRVAVAVDDEREDFIDELVPRLRRDGERDLIVSLVRAADLGIKDIIAEQPDDVALLDEELRMAVKSVERHLAKQKGLMAHVRDGQERMRVEDYLAESEGFLKLAEMGMDRVRYLEERRQALLSSPRLTFRHGSGDGVLSWEQQSVGTRNWLMLVSRALTMIDSRGLLVVDEVDASLHPHLTAQLVNLFRDVEMNPHGAQLLFTTHDSTLLDEDTLSRDEVWFVEKDPDSGATRLYPLTDFHPRKNENTEGRYLAGSYGAIPIVSDYEFREAFRRRDSDEAA